MTPSRFENRQKFYKKLVQNSPVNKYGSDYFLLVPAMPLLRVVAPVESSQRRRGLSQDEDRA